MESEYIEMLLIRLNERRAVYALLVAKRLLKKETEVTIKELEVKIDNLDNRIGVLIPTKK